LTSQAATSAVNCGTCFTKHAGNAAPGTTCGARYQSNFTNELIAEFHESLQKTFPRCGYMGEIINYSVNFW
jgi:hypothetical protein